MQKISKKEADKRFGKIGADKPGFLERTKESARAGLSKIKAGFSQAGKADGIKGLYDLSSGALKIGAGAVDTAFSPITAAVEPVVKPTIGRGLEYTADKISNIPAVQRFADSKAGRMTSAGVEDINNLNTVAGALATPEIAGSAKSAVSTGLSGAVNKAGSAAKTAAAPLKGFAKTALPSRVQLINDEITHAFDLTQGDVRNIFLKNKTDVGTFVAKNNLIGSSVDDSVRLINNFATKNYNQVRSLIGKVNKTYKPTEVPRFGEALDNLLTQVTDVPGLQSSVSEIANLLKKKRLELGDIQRAKELIDEHLNLYGPMGDVKSGLAKQGFANVRGDLKRFIETEVKAGTGVDIRKLNLNVATSKDLLKAIAARSTRGTTRAQMSLGDWGAFLGGSTAGFAAGPFAPLIGAAAVLIKKLNQNPSVRLRIAKYLSSLDEAKQATIKSQLLSGQVPNAIRGLLNSD